MCIYSCYNTVTIFPPYYMNLYYKMCYPYNKGFIRNFIINNYILE